MAFVAVFELVVTPAPLGVNLFTVSATLVLGSLLALGDSIRRLASVD